jgi:hypothetical protein
MNFPIPLDLTEFFGGSAAVKELSLSALCELCGEKKPDYIQPLDKL